MTYSFKQRFTSEAEGREARAIQPFLIEVGDSVTRMFESCARRIRMRENEAGYQGELRDLLAVFMDMAKVAHSAWGEEWLDRFNKSSVLNEVVTLDNQDFRGRPES